MVVGGLRAGFLSSLGVACRRAQPSPKKLQERRKQSASRGAGPRPRFKILNSDSSKTHDSCYHPSAGRNRLEAWVSSWNRLRRRFAETQTLGCWLRPEAEDKLLIAERL
mmetsp:Transcript_4235/g.7501  ORF Transcript_4235/g.7501 Transcript_4235/m.7501 type:complete len:109 (+) Transcript_4235:95-421(+)